ncbi:glycoside hydrolase family 43 protein [Paenibacillus crassostreae]|uniref:Xylosidase n=1 Tax=Paenibacillus crassostreae TaxID=1763538 RepID=A0A167B8Y2_9BACL|nr:glycoside hydrolase family 43 protein [Paenibacillus crassostreae]AOZ93067.1 glycoside hydrolase 43 family protein [Paenibacillus crassostreae]OAB71844.1 xylosidase [Paenibacillus crassostreae]
MSVLQTYTNPVLSGFYPDPSVIRVNDDYYLAVSSFEYYPGLPIFHSRDLIHWEQIGHALIRKSQLDMSSRQSSQGIYAPTLRYHEGVFYLITTDVYGIGNFYITAEKPEGPWSDPILIPYGNIDPSLFFDDDGKVYVTAQNGTDVESHIIQYEIDIKTGKALSEPVVVARGDGGVWTEGPHLYRMKGFYYLTCACGGTGSDHRALVYRSVNPYGPFEIMPHPMLTHNQLPNHPIQNLGHAELVEDAEGNWWTMFLAVRPVDGQYSVLGRETFLAPVTWSEDGWPMVDNNEGTVQFEMTVVRSDQNAEGNLFDEQPLHTSQVGDAIASTSGSGLTSWRDDFDEEQLNHRWAFIRTLQAERVSLSESPGQLTLKGNRHSLKDAEPSLFIGVRQQHRCMSVTTELCFAPDVDGEEAGIAVRLNEQGHLTLGIRMANGTRVLTAAAVDRGEVSILSEVPVTGERIWLRITANEWEYQLNYSNDGTTWWNTIAHAAAHIVSPERNGGFTGALVGLYATGNGVDSQTSAFYDYFDYKISE